MNELFLGFIFDWLGVKILDAGLSSAWKGLEQQLDSLIDQPTANGWDEEWTDEQRRFIHALKITHPSAWNRGIAQLKKAHSRPIIIIGPSGVGKTVVGLQLAGIEPRDVETSREMEIKKLVGALREIKVYIAPGSFIHNEGAVKVLQKLTNQNAPKVVINVVAGGFHATASKGFIGDLTTPNFMRPGNDENVASNTNGFLAYCRDTEEVEYLDSVYQSCKGKIQTRIPWIISVVNKKDLWQALPDPKSIANRYAKKNVKQMQKRQKSPNFGNMMHKLREEFSNGDTLTGYDSLPVYLDNNGFYPDPKVRKLALPKSEMLADAMILRATVYLRYTEGNVVG